MYAFDYQRANSISDAAAALAKEALKTGGSVYNRQVLGHLADSAAGELIASEVEIRSGRAETFAERAYRQGRRCSSMLARSTRARSTS